MTVSEHLDKIFQLGFWITINWNEDFNITYNAWNIVTSFTHTIITYHS